VEIEGRTYNGAVSRDPLKNKELAKAIREARRSNVPQNYIQRVLQLAGQGSPTSISIPMIPTGTPRPTTR
jgi:ribonucleoside-diphosphate reductase alpha chain